MMVAQAGQLVPVHTAGASRTPTKLKCVESEPVQYFLELKCHEDGCNAEEDTPLFREQHQCYEHAMKVMGWAKPSTKSWAHSRCRACRW